MAFYGGGKLMQFGPMAGLYVWTDFNPGRVIAVIDATIHARMEAAMKLAVDIAKENMQQIPPPSQKGDMPAVDSGILKDNIEYKIFDSPSQIIGAFGVFNKTATDPAGKVVDLIYALYLETGTTAGHMNPRPWLTLTVAEVWDQWQSIFGTGGSVFAAFSQMTSGDWSLGGRESYAISGGS